MNKLEFTNKVLENLNDSISEDGKVGLAKFIELTNKLYEAINYTRCCTELPIKELPNCNRVEVIDQKGRSYVNWQPNNKVRLSMQDNGRTAKIFID